MDFSVARKHLERMYFDRCTVFEYEEVEEGGITNHREVERYADVPCHISHNRGGYAKPSFQNGETVVVSPNLTSKLSLAPELEIKAGSKIIVTRNGRSTTYKNSGAPHIFPTHQEISLELDDKRA